jgi:DNA-binding NarL/FixJ family response regulator
MSGGRRVRQAREVIRVLLADDHPMVRAGLEQLLAAEEDINVVGAAADGCEALTMVGEIGADVVLMDLSMPVLDGVEATRRLAAEAPDVRVVVLTSFADRERILAALEAGAAGYLLKDAEPYELLAGVRAASRGETPLAPRAASAVLSNLPSARPELTDREREVLRLLGEGLANKLIAVELGISEQTVKTHLTHIFSRIGVSDRTNAALWARRHGLV